MDRRDTNSSKLKQIAVVAIVGFALAALLYKFDGGAGSGCNLLNGAAWFVLQLLHPVLVAGWHSLQSYVDDNSRLLQRLPDAVACIRPLLCTIGG
jgi:hypothetical protein